MRLLAPRCCFLSQAAHHPTYQLFIVCTPCYVTFDRGLQGSILTGGRRQMPAKGGYEQGLRAPQRKTLGWRTHALSSWSCWAFHEAAPALGFPSSHTAVLKVGGPLFETCEFCECLSLLLSGMGRSRHGLLTVIHCCCQLSMCTACCKSDSW